MAFAVLHPLVKLASRSLSMRAGMAIRAALPLLLCCYTAHALRPVTVPQRTPRLRTLRAPAAPSLCASSTPPPKAPDRAAIRRFAIPALGLWLNGPLLSLVDTSAVGLSALPGTGATQLAALGPATTFCDGAIYLFAFLNVATTNLYASAQAAEGGEASLESEGVVRCAARVALLCGLGAMAVVLTMGALLPLPLTLVLAPTLALALTLCPSPNLYPLPIPSPRVALTRALPLPLNPNPKPSPSPEQVRGCSSSTWARPRARTRRCCSPRRSTWRSARSPSPPPSSPACSRRACLAPRTPSLRCLRSPPPRWSTPPTLALALALSLSLS